MGLIRLLPRPGGAPVAPERATDPAPEPAPPDETSEPVALSEPAGDPEPPVAASEPAAAVEPMEAAVGAERVATDVIALANQKGGVAKTTTTLNLGVALREMGNRVLLVDLDPQGNLTMSQGLNPDVIERSMFDVLVHKVPISEVIEQREVDLAVASIDLAGAELALSALIGRERSLEKALAEVRGSYDFVLIDTPPSLGLLTINAFVAATGVIVPVQCEYLSLRGLVQLENTLAMVRENLNPNVGVEGIVATMFDGRTLHSREAIEILEENFGDLVYRTRIRKTVRYAEAPVKGSSVLKYDPTGAAAEAYRELAREIVAAKEGKDGAQARKHA
jgi:chromosome partitioning protein